LRVQLVDVPAVTPPYDHALAGALARAGCDVELLTMRPPLGGTPAPAPGSYRTVELFGRLGSRLPAGPARRAARLAEGSLDLLRYRRRAMAADVVHYQWLGLEEVSSRLLPPARPRVFTAHDVIPREPRLGQPAAFARIFAAMDAIVVHSEHGAGRLRKEFGVDPGRLHVIPHGAFDHLTSMPDELPLAPELESNPDLPVILFFGFVSAYKGVDVLLEAFGRVEGAGLWVVGQPRVDMEPLQRLADAAPGPVRFLPRYVDDRELPAIFRRADIVVLPYREVDQSGVLYTALAFGKPVVVSRVGGLPDVAEHYGAGLTVAPEDPEALAQALNRLVDDPEERGRLGAAASAAARGDFSWDEVARRHLELYRSLARPG
jgi:glycosyltransferase involved in cell wall biosynthesis